MLFCLTDAYPEAYERHYAFMLEGLAEVAADLRERGIRFAVVRGEAPGPIVAASRQAGCVVTDCGYTRLLRLWRQRLGEQAPVAVFEVEGEVVVPSKLLTDRHDSVAATFRPRLARLVKQYLVDVVAHPVSIKSLELDPLLVLGSNDTPAVLLDLDAGVQSVLGALSVDRSVPRVCAGGDAADEALRGGAREAKRHLHRFFSSAEGVAEPAIEDYAVKRNNMCLRKQSHLSPYLHFGHISVVAVALQAQAFAASHPRHERNVHVFWDELVIRREFAVHFVLKHPKDYDIPRCLPAWALAGLREHEGDTRPRIYTAEQMEKGKTDDAYWNAAQLEMVITGKMHNYLRMYWAKQVIKWTQSVDQAYAFVLHQNNKWELDGRGPNGFAGVAWCFGHADTPFPDRPIYGPVRCMTASGLEKKFEKSSIERYVKRILALRKEVKGKLPAPLAFARLSAVSNFFQRTGPHTPAAAITAGVLPLSPSAFSAFLPRIPAP